MRERSEISASFLHVNGWGNAMRTPLTGDASTRRYERLELKGQNALLMDAPQEVETTPCPPQATPAERQTLGYNACARLAGADMNSFVKIADALTSYGLSAPEIYALDADNGLAIIEDLGDAIYAQTINDGSDELELYKSAIDVLVAIGQCNCTPAKLLNYDNTAFLAEVNLLLEWYWPYKHGNIIPDNLKTEYLALWQNILTRLSTPSVLVLRDYHAENLLWLPERDNIKRTGLIDFQDALVGHHAYDVVSLLEDARRDVSPILASQMTQRYCEGLSLNSEKMDIFYTEYSILGAQRNAKILGIFARLAHRDGKLKYLDLIPRVEKHFQNNIRHSALAPIYDFMKKHIPELTA